MADIDLVIVRFDDAVSVFYGRYLHRGALMCDGFVDGNDNLICGVHNWDYKLEIGISEYNNSEVLEKFSTWIEGGDVLVDEDEVRAWGNDNPQPFNRDAYLSLYADTSHGTGGGADQRPDPAICPRRSVQDRPSRPGLFDGRATRRTTRLG